MLPSSDLPHREPHYWATIHHEFFSSSAQTIQARLQLRNLLSRIIRFSEILFDESNRRSLCSIATTFRTIIDTSHHLLRHITQRLDPYQQTLGDIKEVCQQIKSFVEKIEETLQPIAAKLPQQFSSLFFQDIQNIRESLYPMLELVNQELLESTPSQKKELISEKDDLPPLLTPDPRKKNFLSQPHSFLTVPSSILIVDDDPMNLSILEKLLDGHSLQIETISKSHQVMGLLSEKKFDLVLLDLVMPEPSGEVLLSQIKSDPSLKEIRIIITSAIDDINSIAGCIEKGADDYLLKPINPVLLTARVFACLESKRLRDREIQTYQALIESQCHLASELAEAAHYVQSFLPPPLHGEVKTDWRFIPSKHLGGDALGYHWIDEDHFSFYLLDVCGHGVSAALLSISIMTLLRFRSLENTDYRQPSEVLSTLNRSYQMTPTNRLFFSIWYGVYHKKQRQLVYANAGHPPALFSNPNRKSGEPFEKLDSHGMIIGALPSTTYTQSTKSIESDSQLFLFSDGAYEIRQPNGDYLEFEDFATLLSKQQHKSLDLDQLISQATEIQNSKTFIDDYSVLSIAFQ